MMPNNTNKPRPWLIAAWPGMGNVAIIAAGHVVQELRMQETAELPSRGHFDIGEISVKGGLIVPVRLPRGRFFRWTNPQGGRDLVVFFGEAQPSTGTYAYARELLEAAKELNVERVVTFASMASALHPAANPKVAGIATDLDALGELRRAEIEPLQEGQISGLNGVVLAAAAEHAMSGLCLLAEIPFFAAGVPNPKAARAALSVFCVLAGVEISLDELNKHAVAVDRMLVDAYEKLQAEGVLGQEATEEHEPGEPQSSEPQESEPKAPSEGSAGLTPEPGPVLDLAARHRIEQLFDDARKDRGKAMALKQELDRLKVFKQYEHRFLDLFRRAE